MIAEPYKVQMIFSALLADKNTYDNPRLQSHMTHGMSATRFYNIWAKMLGRCYSPRAISFNRYGAKGIKVCNRWKNFLNFKKDLFADYRRHSIKHGERNTTLDRIDNKKGYGPKNCQWATYEVQANNMTTNLEVTYNGKKYTLTRLAKKVGISVSLLWYRLYKYKWPLEKALTQKPDSRRGPRIRKNQDLL